MTLSIGAVRCWYVTSVALTDVVGSVFQKVKVHFWISWLSENRVCRASRYVITKIRFTDSLDRYHS